MAEKKTPKQMSRRQFGKVASLFSGVAAAVLGGVKVATPAAIDPPLPVLPSKPAGYNPGQDVVETEGADLASFKNPVVDRIHDGEVFDARSGFSPEELAAWKKVKWDEALSKYVDGDPRKGFWERFDEGQQAELGLKVALRSGGARGLDEEGRALLRETRRDRRRAFRDLGEKLRPHLAPREPLPEARDIDSFLELEALVKEQREVVLFDTAHNRAFWELMKQEQVLKRMPERNRPRVTWKAV